MRGRGRLRADDSDTARVTNPTWRPLQESPSVWLSASSCGPWQPLSSWLESERLGRLMAIAPCLHGRPRNGEVVGAMNAIAATHHWLEHAVIRLNLCPLARAVQVKRQIPPAESPARDENPAACRTGREGGLDLNWYVVLFAVYLQTSLLMPQVEFSLFYMTRGRTEGNHDAAHFLWCHSTRFDPCPRGRANVPVSEARDLAAGTDVRGSALTPDIALMAGRSVLQCLQTHMTM